jgi:hypothetical protein
LYIGGDDVTHSRFYGMIDEFLLFNRSITDAEASLLNNSGKGCQLGNETCFHENTAPIITLNAPVNEYNSSSVIIFFNYTPQDDFGIANTTLYINDIVNNTNTSGFNNTLISTLVSVPQGKYLWHCGTCDTYDNCTNSSYRNITVDLTAPLVSIIAPASSVTSAGITINVSSQESVTLTNTCYYNITRGASTEKANTIITNGMGDIYYNTTYSLSGEATYNLWVNCNDTVGNMNVTNKTFTYSAPSGSTNLGGGGGTLITADIITKTINVCEVNKPFLDTALTIWKKDMFNLPKFLALWYAYWDYALCYSAGSVIPIEIEIQVNSTDT